MKKQFKRWVIAGIALITATVMSQASFINLAESATGTGMLPNISLSGGTIGAVINGDAWEFSNLYTSPYTNSDTNLQPYITWDTPQQISTVQVWNDYVNPNWNGPIYDRVAIDTLADGGNPNNENDWVQRYDSGTGLNADELRVALGGTFTTSGVRVRATTSGAEGTKVAVGEIAVFKEDLDSKRVLPITANASSTQWVDRTAAQVSDSKWIGSYWLSQNADGNPGDVYTLDLGFDFGEKALAGVSLTWGNLMPAAWTLQYDTGNGFQTFGTFTPDGTRRLYFHDFGGVFSGEGTMRLLVNESDAPDGIKIVELEAFIPEPASGLLLLLGGLCLLQRRSRA